MTAHYPIIPAKAVEFVEGAGVPDPRRILADFAAAGLVKTYALVIETVDASGARSLVRGSSISPSLWQRIIRDAVATDVWSGGTVRLRGSGLIGGEPDVSITGISFSEQFLRWVVDHHQSGAVVKPKPATVAPKTVSAAAGPTSPATRRKSRIPPPFTGSLDGELLTITETKAVLRCGQTKIYKLINSKRLERRETDAGVRITTRSVKEVAGITDDD